VRSFLKRKKISQDSGVFKLIYLFHPFIEKTSRIIFLIISLYLTSNSLVFSPYVDKVREKIFIVAIFIQLFLWANILISDYIEFYFGDKHNKNHNKSTAINVINVVVKFLVFSCLFLLGLDQLGFNVNTLIAGLGVGGIAVALSVQNILGDLFASLTIIFDRPFEVGDFLTIDDYKGTVEIVGLKTTRLKSLTGEQIIISNSDLLKGKIRNFQKLKERRILFNFGVEYGTPVEKLKKIPSIVEQIVKNQKLTRFDRTHFSSLGDFSLNFEVVYFVLDSDYKIYMDIHQNINLQLIEELSKLEVEFAFPTQTLIMQNSSNE